MVKSVNKKSQIITNMDGNEIAMIRVDKTIKELMEEKPSSRWDPDYWHPKYEKIMASASKKLKILPLNKILEESIIAPDHVRASKGEEIGKKFDCEYRTLKDLLFTGLNYAETNYCSDNAYQRLRRSQLEVGDILFAGSGVGAIGRLGIVEKVTQKSCVGDLFVLRRSTINNYYLYVYLLTEYGQSQIERIFHGIQSAKISTTEIGHIKIVILDQKSPKKVESGYKKMSIYHQKAMQALKEGKKADYNKNIEIAEKMLTDLIKKTEALIRGETGVVF